jgi:hypothetical protein
MGILNASLPFLVPLSLIVVKDYNVKLGEIADSADIR